MSAQESRYARQEILPEFGGNGQTRLRAAHVLVVGAGGLGCPVLSYLAAAGIGRITLVDEDVVERTNLHRQPLYREDQIGTSKALAAQYALAQLNPDSQVHPVVSRLDADNVAQLLSGVDLALDCADSFAASYILSDACMAAKIPLFSASALGLTGYLGGFCGGAPSLRAVFPELPDRAANCSTAGVLGSVVGTIGALQAQMALNHLLDIGPSPLGQLLTLDCKTLRFGGFRFDKAPEPEGNALTFIAPTQITSKDFVVELRDTSEAPVPVIASAIRHSVSDFQQNGPTPEAGQRAVLCCRSGLRSWQAAKSLQSYWAGEIVLVALGDTPANA